MEGHTHIGDIHIKGTYIYRGDILKKDIHMEGTYILRNIHTKGYTYGGDICMEEKYTWSNIHTK